MRHKTLALALITLAAMGCTSQNANMKTDDSNKPWISISPKDLQNPIQQFADDWMLLSAGHEGKNNAMTIGWGQYGVLWGKPVLTVYVSNERYTKEFMDENEYFTVMGFSASKKDALQYMGTHSGRDGDKTEMAGLTPEFTKLGNTLYKEANLAVECRKIYVHDFDTTHMQGPVSGLYSKRGDLHTVYVGEIINAWKK